MQHGLLEHPGASLLLDADGHVTLANQAIIALTGLSADDLVGRDLGHVVHPSCHDDGVERIRAARAGRPQLYDTRVRAADGEYRDIRVVLHPVFDDGRVVGLSLVGHDITADLRAQQELARSERRYRSLATHARVGIYEALFDHGEGRFAYVNPALADMCGIPAQAFYDDMHVARFHVPEEDQQALGIDAGRRTHILAEPARYRWIRPDGEVRWHEAAEVPVRDDDGRLVSVQGIIHDVTDLVEERAALRNSLHRQEQAVRELQHVNEMKNTFLQSVSHELRTPLTAILGSAETLLDWADELDATARATMHDSIHRNATRLTSLLADLLDVDRLARGIVEPRLTRHDLGALVEDVLSGMDLETRRVTTRLASAPVSLDGPKFERVVENLVANAVRHTPHDVPVRVIVETDGPLARLVVEDDGDGIPDDIKAKLFEPFFQGPGSEQRASPGTGIGLALVARLTALHDGVVRVEDSDGDGARFVVELPLAEVAHGVRTG